LLFGLNPVLDVVDSLVCHGLAEYDEGDLLTVDDALGVMLTFQPTIGHF